MIERYDSKKISDIWKDEAKFSTYLEVELALLEALEKFEIANTGDSEKVRKKAQVDVQRISEIEQTVKHDVIAFTTQITENLGEERRFFHYGVTSSDIIDTSLSLQIRRSIKELKLVYLDFIKSLFTKAKECSDIISMGRSHGINAEPMIFGQKFLFHAQDFTENLRNLIYFDSTLSAQFSGAVGNYTVLDPEIEEEAAKRLGLNVCPVSTQVISRRVYASIINEIAAAGALLERLAVELRLLQHSDIGEVYEGFSSKQKGSSTMPHKKNPISSENITGISRLLKSYAQPALENIVLWHERDISHSSTERVIFPDAFGYLYYAMNRMNSVIKNLVIDKKNIENKVIENQAIGSSFYLHQLLLKTKATREEIYEAVQKVSFKYLKDGNIKISNELEQIFGVKLEDFSIKELKTFYKQKFSIVQQRTEQIFNDAFNES